MTSESPQLMQALPVRRRETLEIFDTALKLFRRYAWVLLGWSALSSVLALIPGVSFLAFLTMPLLEGAASCCVAAAVRGQKVTFGQCWSFTKPRYGAMLGVIVLSYIIFFCVVIALYIAAALLFVVFALILSNVPVPVQVVGGIIGFLLAMVAFSCMGVVAFGWAKMVPIVACLEDDKRGTAAMGRAFDLLKGNWRRVFGMALIIGLAIIAVLGIVVGIFMLIGAAQWSDIFSGNPSNSAILGLVVTLGGFMAIFAFLWNPAHSLIIAVLYLDLRVRREALDLEWSAYSSAPPVPVAPTTAILDAPAYGGALHSTAPSTPLVDGAAPTDFAPASFSAGSAVENVGPVSLDKPLGETTPPVAPFIPAPPSETLAAATAVPPSHPIEAFSAEAPAPLLQTPPPESTLEIPTISDATGDEARRD
jgi:hypothetical protein